MGLVYRRKINKVLSTLRGAQEMQLPFLVSWVLEWTESLLQNSFCHAALGFASAIACPFLDFHSHTHWQLRHLSQGKVIFAEWCVVSGRERCCSN